jgi:cyclopropane-fatty-acyl-phospholipid synthase
MGNVTLERSSTVQEPAEAITIALLKDLFSSSGGLPFNVLLWNGRVLEADSHDGSLTLTLTHPGSLKRMLLPPGELTLAEAYLRGDFDVGGDIIALLGQVEQLQDLRFRDWLSLLWRARSLPRSDPPVKYETGRRRSQISGREHSKERDRQAVTYHYDTGNDFYALFLGQWMAYSCAYFQTADTALDLAQEAKFEHICRKLRLQPGENLLDIGCGWGGLVVYAAEKYGVQATGINLSQPQIDYANRWIQTAGLEGQAEVISQDYRDIDPGHPYDKIVSVGMVEHVGRANLDEYFQSAYRALKPGGLFLNHAIATHRRRQDTWFEKTFLQSGRFMQNYVFPDGELVWIGEMLNAAERLNFEVRDVEGLREHYALTLRNWIANLEANHDQAVALNDERTYRTWRLYMASSALGFERQGINVYQALLSKTEKGQARLPLTRAELYQA